MLNDKKSRQNFFNSDTKLTIVSLELSQGDELRNGSNSKGSPSDTSEETVEITTSGRKTFSSKIGSLISCLGSAAGTGNIWRFPRILATHSSAKGSLTFYIAWIIILFSWSIPIIILEYALGRFTRNSVPVTFNKFLGKYSMCIGGWLVASVFFLSCYYPVIVGWCLYYLYVSVSVPTLPSTEEAGLSIFNHFARDSYWPVFTQILTVVITGVFLFGGIRWIEWANLVLVPLLLLIVIFTFGWSLTRNYAEIGIAFLFTPTWSDFTNSGLWIAAASQNAFDTGAGMALFMTYSIYINRRTSIVRYSVFVPIANNIISLYASFTLFSTVFSTLILSDPTITRASIVKIMKTAGPGSTGLTFTWIPVLYSKVGIFGRVLCSLFFLCLSFAGISSLISEIQVYIVALKDMGVSHRIAVGISLLACVVVGLPSAMSLEFLENQDNTWGYALIVSGLLLTIIPIVYGPLRFRRTIINDFGIGDWKVPLLWIPIITILVPLQTMILIIWWIYHSIQSDEKWYHITLSSMMCTLVEWAILVVLLLLVNLIAVGVKRDTLCSDAKQFGCDPYNPTTYEAMEKPVQMSAIRVKQESKNYKGTKE